MDSAENKIKLNGWGCLALLLLFSLFFFDTPNRYWFLYKLLSPGPNGPEPYFPAVCAAWVLSSGIYLLGIAAGMRIFRISIPTMGWKIPARPLKTTIWGALAGLAGIFFNITVLNSVLYRLEGGVWRILPFSIADPRVGVQDVYHLFMGVTAWTFVPISEELVYRGLLYTVAERRWGKIVALLLSSVVFALSHFYSFGDLSPHLPHIAIINKFLKYLVCGLVLGIVRMRSGSLVPAIAGHAAINIGISIMAGSL